MSTLDDDSQWTWAKCSNTVSSWGFPGLAKWKPDCLERLWLISHYLHPLIHHYVTEWSTKQAQSTLWLFLFAIFSLPDNRWDRCCPLGLCNGGKCSYLITIISKYLAQLHSWRSSGNNLHSFHRCWPFKRNADFELHLSFQNIAFSLN